MKNLSVAILLLTLLSLSSCQAIGDIFKAGVGVGVFIVILVVGLIVFLISKAGGSK